MSRGVIRSPMPELICVPEDIPPPIIIDEKTSLNDDTISEVDELEGAGWVAPAERLFAADTGLIVLVMMSHSKIKGEGRQ